MLFVLCVALAPFASAVLGAYRGFDSAILFYVVVSAFTAIIERCLWVYVSRGHRLVDADLPRAPDRPEAYVRRLIAQWRNGAPGLRPPHTRSTRV
jgi:hypothetical protein